MKLILKLVIFSLILFLVIFVAFSAWIRTESAQNRVLSFVESYVSDQVGMQINISSLNVSLPLIINVESIAVSQDKEKILDLKNLYINILPALSFIWEVNIWNISADEIRLHKVPEFNTITSENVDNKSFFNPDILVRKINIGALILDPKLTGQNEDISFFIESNILYRAKKSEINYSVNSNLLSPSIQGLEDLELNMVGQYNMQNSKLVLPLLKIFANEHNYEGELVADIENDELSGFINYHSDFTSLFNKEKTEHIASTKGRVDFLDKLTTPKIKISGDFDLKIPSNEYLRLYPFLYDISLLFEDGKVKSSISLKQEDLEIKGDVVYSQDILYLNDFRAESEGFLKTANFKYNILDNIITGNLNVVDKNLKILSRYLPFLWSGAVDLNIDFMSDDSKTQKFDVTGRIKRLNTKYGLFGYINTDLHVIDLWGGKVNDSFVKVRSYNYNNFSVREMGLDFKMIEDSMIIDSYIASSVPYPVDLKFTSKVVSSLNKVRGEISNLFGSLRNIKLEQKGPINFDLGATSIFNMDNLAIGQGKVTLAANFGVSEVDSKLNINSVPLEAFPDFLPDVFKKSLIDSETVLSGTYDNPKLNSNTNIKNINIGEKQDVLSLEVTSSCNKYDLNIDMKVVNKETEFALGNLNLPINFSLNPLSFLIEHKKTIGANIEILKSFDFMSLIPIPSSHKISGFLDGKLKLSGKIEDPYVSGTINVTDGTYKFKNYGIKLGGISGKLNASGKELSLVDFKLHDSFGNRADITGQYILMPSNKFDLSINTDKFHPMNTRYLQGETKGNINVKGDNNQGAVKGILHLGPLEIKIPEQFRKNIPTLNISEIIEEGKQQEEIISTDIDYKLALDIKLKADNKVYVRGWGVDTQLAGDLQISGFADEPLIYGVLYSERGRYQEFGKVLNIKKAILNFDGPISPSPFLNIVGATNVGNAEIRLVLSGSILNPDVSIESTPELSQEDALSRLLFGGDIQDISTFQALQLADGMRRLSGHGGGFDPLGLGRKILGVDDISFKSGSGDSEENSIGVGKHLTDKVYFEIERGRSENSTKTKLEVQLSPKTTLENVYEQEGNTSIGINWKFDY